MEVTMKDVYEQMMARQQTWYGPSTEVSRDADTARYTDIIGTSVDVRRADQIGWFSERSDLLDVLRENGF